MGSDSIRMLRDLEPALRAGGFHALRQRGVWGQWGFQQALSSARSAAEAGPTVGPDIVDIAGRIGLTAEEIKEVAAAAAENTGKLVTEGDGGVYGMQVSRRARFRAMVERIAKHLGIESDELLKRVRSAWHDRQNAAGHTEVKPWRPVQPRPAEAPTPVDDPSSTIGETRTPATNAPDDVTDVPATSPVPTDDVTTSDPADSAGTDSTTGTVVPAPVSNPQPASGDLQPVTVTGQTITLDNESNRSVTGISLNGTEHGIMVNNQQHSANVLVDGFSARNVTGYGMYLGDVSHWTIQNTTLTQASGALQHGLRVAAGDNLVIRNTTIDTSQAGKSSVWFIDVDHALIEDSTIRGGAIRIGARPGDGQGEPTPSNITIRDTVIQKVSGGDQHAIHVWPGAENVHFENLDITITTSDRWLYIDPRNTGNITWKNIRVNGVLIQDYQGVELDGLSQQQARDRGVGPAS